MRETIWSETGQRPKYLGWYDTRPAWGKTVLRRYWGGIDWFIELSDDNFVKSQFHPSELQFRGLTEPFKVES